MESGILAPELKSIDQLFTSDSQYVVPTYQRSFAWGIDEIEALWEDLIYAKGNARDYFLGTIVLHKKMSQPQEIIDGQQRLTCISMIISAIRRILINLEDKERATLLFSSFLGAKDYSRKSEPKPKLHLNQINHPIFQEFIIDSKDLDEVKERLKRKELDESNRFLLQAYKFFLEKISEYNKNNFIDEFDQFCVPFIDCLRSKIKIITIPVTSEEDANLFFESLNARGKELAVSDLVKNRLYSAAKGQISLAQSLWEQMESDLSKVSIPGFLRHFWIAKKADQKSLLVREKNLYRNISHYIKNDSNSTTEFLQDLATSANDYAKINDFSQWPENDVFRNNIEGLLNELELFRVTQCNPILLNSIQKFSKQPKYIVDIFRIVVNFSYRYFIIGNQSPGNLERIANKIAFDVRTGKHTEPKHIAKEFLNINSNEAFINDFSLAVILKNKNNIARYTLSKINDFLQRSNVSKEFVVNPNANDVNLEHILPQNPNQEWVSAFTKGADMKDYIYRIGNLTLLDSKSNKNIGNSNFLEKQKLALGCSNLQINQSLRNVNKWGNTEIENRQKELAAIAILVWPLKT